MIPTQNELMYEVEFYEISLPLKKYHQNCCSCDNITPVNNYVQVVISKCRFDRNIYTNHRHIDDIIYNLTLCTTCFTLYHLKLNSNLSEEAFHPSGIKTTYNGLGYKHYEYFMNEEGYQKLLKFCNNQIIESTKDKITWKA